MYLISDSQLFYCTQGKIMKILGLTLALSIASLLSVSASAAIDYKKITVDNCKSNEYSSINFCDEKALKKVAELADRKPNLAGKSVFMRFWDKETNAWRQVALNKETNTLHTMHKSISSRGKNPRNVTMTVEGNKICGIGNDLHYKGSYVGMDFDDSSDDYDYCVKYDPNEGFGVTIEVDGKTRAYVDTLPY